MRLMGSAWSVSTTHTPSEELENQGRMTTDTGSKTVKAYEYKDAASLVADLWREVEAVMKAEGVWQ
jgi:hypothetical protein